MAKFTDRLGRDWTLDITVHDIIQVRKGLGIDLFNAFAGDYAVYSAIVSDVEKLVGVAYILCRDQITRAGLTEEDFGKGVAGDSLRGLADAFSEALVDFFPNARGRDVVRATLAKAKELVELRTSLLAQAVAKLDLASMTQKPNPGSMSAPASLASTPPDSPSAP